MRKILLILVVVLTTYYFLIYLKNNSDPTSLDSKPTAQLRIQKSKASHAKPAVQDLSLQHSVTLPVQTVEKKYDPQATALPAVNENKNDQIAYKMKSAEQIANEKFKIPINEELKKAVSINVLNTAEANMTGIYEGEVSINGQAYSVRLNLLFWY